MLLKSFSRTSLLTLAIALHGAVGGLLHAEPPREWIEASADEFDRIEALDQVVDAGTLHHELLSAAIFHQTNRARQAHDLSALRYDGKLEAAARMHADDMVREGFFAHENPNDPAKRNLIDRIRMKEYDPRFCAENLITAFDYNYESGRTFYIIDGQPSYSPDGPPIPRFTYRQLAASMVDRWMNSPGHRVNILSEHAEEIGIHVTPADTPENGMIEMTGVQNFGAKMPR